MERHLTRFSEKSYNQQIGCLTSNRTLQEDNDTYGEHDFGVIKLHGNTFFWKFDCYDVDLLMHPPDSSDLTVTTRVLTIMLADEY